MITSIYIVKGGEIAQTGQAWHGAGTDSSLTEQGEKSSASLQSKVAFCLNLQRLKCQTRNKMPAFPFIRLRDVHVKINCKAVTIIFAMLVRKSNYPSSIRLTN